jgi:hypothetical protein
MPSSASTSNSTWWIDNNYITQYGAGSLSSSMIYIKGSNIKIRGNRIITKNDLAYSPGILIYNYGNGVISDNIIEVGEGDDSANEIAIFVAHIGSYSIKILNNIISRVSGDSFYAGLGIYVVGGSSVDVCGNTISNMGGGICLLSTSISGANISDNTLSGCYHFGIKVYTSTVFSSLDNLKISGNLFSNMTKNSSGSALSVFGTGLYGIYLNGTLDSTATFGNIDISNNNITTLSSAVGSVYGIISGLIFDVSSPITAGVDCLSIDGNSIKDLSSTNNDVYAADATFYSGAGASTLLIKDVSLSNNKLKSLSALNGNAHGIYAYFDLDSSNTTLLGGLNINGNSVSGFYGENVASGVADGIRAEDVGPFGSVFGFVCSGNTVGTVSNNTVAAGTDNDATHVCGIYNSLKNSIISNNSITINGSGGTLSTARGDGIRLFAYGSTPLTIRSVVSGNVIQVNWAGIHAKSSLASALFEIHGNRINAGSVGIYLDAGLEGCLISDNTICVTAANDWEDTGCTLTGAACIANQPSSGDASVISGNNLYLIGSSNTYSANIWADRIPGFNIDGNRTVQSGAVVNDVFHIRAYNCTGSCSISGNTIDNSARSGANGIYVDNTADVFTNFSVLNNNIRGANVFGSGIYECYVNAFFGGGATALQAFVLGNTIKINVGAGAAPNTYVGGSAVNYYGTTTTDYDNVKVASDTTVTRW